MILLAAALTLVTADGPVPAPPPVLDNASVRVERTQLTPGASIEFPPDMAPLLLIQLTEGDAQVRLLGEDSRGLRPAGFVTFAPKGESSFVVNKGMTPFDLLSIRIKPTRPAAPSAPVTEAPPGITRTMRLDNSDVRVVHVQFAANSREPIHTHPNDLLTIQLTPGTLDVIVGESRTSGRQAAGFTRFLPRGVSHAYVSTELCVVRFAQHLNHVNACCTRLRATMRLWPPRT